MTAKAAEGSRAKLRAYMRVWICSDSYACAKAVCECVLVAAQLPVVRDVYELLPRDPSGREMAAAQCRQSVQ